MNLKTIKQLRTIPKLGQACSELQGARSIKKAKASPAPNKVRNMSSWCNIKKRYVYDNEK